MKRRDLPGRSAVTRRQFITRAAAGASGVLLLRSSRSAFAFAANERLNLAIVGVAGYCAANAFVPAVHLYDNVGITALCDVDQRKVAPALKTWRERAANWPASQKEEERRGAEHYRRLAEQPPPLFEDYRQMIDKASRDFDAVVVATPDHSHAAPSALAIRAGKHVLCEKPLTITVNEARTLRDLAAQHKAATSLGNQGTQSGPFRRGLELIRDGAIGQVEQVHVWFDRGGRNHRRPPQGAKPVPPELNWDLWLGPAAWREYHPEWIARTHWRDTSAGELGNFGPHTANLPFMGLQVADLWRDPAARIVIEAECSETNRLSFPTWEKIRWRVPARGDQKPVTFTWHQGPGFPPGSRDLFERLMRERGATDEEVKKLLLYAGAILVGSEGALVTDSHNVNVTLLPEEKFADITTREPKTVPASRGHYRDWLIACRGGAAPIASFDYAAPFNEFLMLGDVATRFPGVKLEYDPAAARILNHAEANQALGYEYRKGWQL